MVLGTRPVARSRPADRPGPGAPGSAPTSVPPPRIDWRWRAAAVVLLGLVVPAVLVSWGPTRLSLLNLVLLEGLVLWSAYWLVVHSTALPTRFFAALFHLFVYVFVGVASLAQAVASAYPQDNLDYAQTQVTNHVLTLWIGVVAFEIGHVLTLRARRSRDPDPDPDAAVPTDRRRALGLSPGRLLALSVVGLVAVAAKVAVYGPVAFLSSREQTTSLLAGNPTTTSFYLAQDKTSGLLQIFVTQVFVFVALYLVLYARRHGLWAPDVLIGRLGWRVVITLLVLANLLVNNPIGTSRYWFCLVSVAFVSVYLPLHERRNVILYVGLGLTVLLFAFSFLDYFRYSEDLVQTHGLTNASYPVLQTGMNGEQYVADNGHTDGRQLLGSLLGFVPRSVWPDKAIDTGQLIDPQYARSASAWTEMTVDFGVSGVVVFFLLWGALAVAVDARLGRRTTGVVPALLVLLSTYQLFLLRGSFLSGLGTLYELGFLFACATVLPLRARRTGPPTGLVPVRRRFPRPVVPHARRGSGRS